MPRPALAEWLDRLTAAGARLAGTVAYEALRVAAVLPRAGLDTDDRTIPHEVGWIEAAVHLSKGCYRGQETVARVANMGRAPRRLVLLHLDSGDERLPVAGEAVTHDGHPVGRVGTVVQHHELGPVALALVKRSVPLDAELIAGADTPARIDPGWLPRRTPTRPAAPPNSACAAGEPPRSPIPVTRHVTQPMPRRTSAAAQGTVDGRTLMR